MSAHTKPAPPRKLLEEAADWLLKTQEQTLDTQQAAAFQHWLSSSPAHREAWHRVERLTDKFGILPSEVSLSTLDRPDDERRRALLAKMVLLAISVPAGWGTWRLAQRQAFMSDYVTRIGEIQTHTLQEGSIITLNTNSAVDVTLNNQNRLLALRKGEVHIQTSPQTVPRPFEVTIPDGKLRALGTRFTVRLLSRQTHLAVYEGSVKVTPSHYSAKIVEAGQQVLFSANSMDNPAQVEDHQSAWTLGMLMADGMPIKKLAKVLRRYRYGKLRVATEIADLRVSGAYPLTDTDKVLSMLSNTYAVRVQHSLFGFVTTLSAE